MAKPLRKDRFIKIHFSAPGTAQLSTVHSVTVKAVCVLDFRYTAARSLAHSSSDFLLVRRLSARFKHSAHSSARDSLQEFMVTIVLLMAYNQPRKKTPKVIDSSQFPFSVSSLPETQEPLRKGRGNKQGQSTTLIGRTVAYFPDTHKPIFK